MLRKENNDKKTLESQCEIGRFFICFFSLIRFLPSRACLKNHFRNLQAPLCGIFYPYSVAVARYAALIRIKSPTNWDSQLTKSLFQTRSSTKFNIHDTGNFYPISTYSPPVASASFFASSIENTPFSVSTTSAPAASFPSCSAAAIARRSGFPGRTS